MKNKEFLEFLIEAETPPTHLKELARKDILLSFHARALMIKFLSYQVLGAIISLSFCPQFGMSFFVEGHGITHHLRMIGDFACALFCGSLFLSVGSVIALLSMKGEELTWLWNRKKFFLTLIPALFWGVLMLLNVSLSLPGEGTDYHLWWILAAIGAQVAWMKGRSLLNRRTV